MTHNLLQSVRFAAMAVMVMAFAAFICMNNASVAMAAKAIGESLPHDLSAVDHNKTPQSFDSLTGDKGLIVFFIRSADWCRFCKKQLAEVSKINDQIEDRGYKVVTVSYDSVDVLGRYATQNQVPFVMLSDPKSDIIKAFGVLKKTIDPSSRAYGIPDPAIYIIGANKNIQAVLAEENYRDRPDLKVVLDMLQMMGQK